MTRVGASRIFFDVVAQWQADKLLYDVETSANVMRAVLLDSFDAALGPLSDFGIRIDQLVEEVKELGLAFGEARVGFEKFIDISNQQALDNMNDSLVEMGLNYAMTGVETMEAAQRMAQMGAVIGQQNVQIGTELGVLFAMISGMETETAMRRLTNLQQQTNFMYGENTRAQFMAMSAQEQQNAIYENTVSKLDALNTVENRSIATMEQLTFTMNQFAAQGHLVGESIEEMAAMSATLIEAGEQQGAAGRALRMMYARLGGNISGTADKLQELGIQTHDTEGNMLALTDIMQQLRDQGWDNTTEGVKQNIAQVIAGNRHYVRFIKLMENYDRRLQLTAEAEAGYMGALEERNRLLQTETKTYQKVTAQVDEYKTKIGTALLPAMTEAQKVQLSYNQALEGFVSGRYGEEFAGMAEGLVKAREVMRIQGGFLELQLTVQAISIGLGTIRSVLAAITGETIANDSAYRAYRFNVEAAGFDIEKQKQTMQEIKMLTNEQASIGKQLQALAASNKEIKRSELAIENALESLYQKEVYYEDQITKSSMQKFAFKKQGYALKVQEINMLTTEYLKERTNEAELISLNEIRRNKLEGITEEHRETVVQMEKRRKGLLETHRLLDLETFKQKEIFRVEGAKLEQHNASKLLSNATNLLNDDELQTAQLNFSEAKKTVKALKNQREEIVKMLMAYDTMLLKRRAEYNLTREHNYLKKVTKLNEEDRADNIQRIVALEQILVDLGLMENTNDREQLTLEQRKSDILKHQVAIEQQINDAVEARQILGKRDLMESATAMQKAKVAGMGFAASLNMLSMVIPMVVQGENGMRMSMIATTLAMFPMIAQMMKATISMAQLGATALTTGKAIQFALTGAGIGVGLFLLANYMSDTRDEAAKAAEEAKNLEQQLMRIQAAQSRLLGQKDKDERLFATDEIAESLGLLNVPLSELAASADLVNQTLLDTKAAFDIAYSDEQRTNLESTVALLEEIQSAQASLAIQGSDILATSASDFEQYNSRVQGAFYDVISEMENDDLKSIFNIDEEQDLHDITSLFNEYKTKLNEFDGDYSDTISHLRSKSLKLSFSLLNAGEMSVDQIKRISDEKKSIDVLLDLFLSVDEAGANVFNMQTAFNEAIEDGNDAILAYSKSVLSFSEDVMDGASLGVTEFEQDLKNVNEEMFAFANNAEELFFGGKFGNVTGSLYKQVVTQGVGTLYNKNEVLVSNNFHGFFNEKEAADKIIAIVTEHLDNL